MVVWLLGARKSQSWGVVTAPYATLLGGSKSQKTLFCKSFRESSSHHFEPFPDEKYSKLTILDHF
jgi:hypothetical protein